MEQLWLPAICMSVKMPYSRYSVAPKTWYWKQGSITDVLILLASPGLRIIWQKSQSWEPEWNLILVLKNMNKECGSCLNYSGFCYMCVCVCNVLKNVQPWNFSSLVVKGSSVMEDLLERWKRSTRMKKLWEQCKTDDTVFLVQCMCNNMVAAMESHRIVSTLQLFYANYRWGTPRHSQPGTYITLLYYWFTFHNYFFLDKILPTSDSDMKMNMTASGMLILYLCFTAYTV